MRCRGFVETIDYPAASTFGPRRLIDYEFVWVLTGSATLRMELEPSSSGRGSEPVELLLTPGTLALTRTGTIDSYHWAPDRASAHAWVHFELVDGAALPPPHIWPLTRSSHDNPVLAGLCDYLVDLGARPSVAAHERTDDLVAVLLDLFVTGPLAEGGPRLPVHVDAAVDHVRRRWRDDGVGIIDVEDLAAAAGVSTGHLFRVFRAAYGCGPAHALELVRLTRAATALQRSNTPLAAIARQVGFANPYHLSRRFSRAYGVPPGEYRTGAGPLDPYAPLDSPALRQLARAVTA